MKKSFEFAGYWKAAVIAKGFAMAVAVALLAGCSGKEYVGELGDLDLTAGAEDLITFNAGTSALTRAPFAGADAAAKLSNHFVVYGTKHSVAENGYATNDKLVFNNYNLSWKDGSAGTSLSNTSGWEYVGNTSYSAATTEQSIKYWDYGATAGYTFYAFSSSDISYPAQASDPIVITKTLKGTNAWQKGYSVKIKNGANLDGLYFSDRKAVAKADFNKPVTFKFHSFGAKVRVGFYETIPGYTVTIKRFYYEKYATEATTDFTKMTDADEDNFRAAVQNVKKSGVNNEVTVVYDISDNTPSIVNTTVTYNYDLTLGSNIKGKTLGTTSNTATYDREGAAYTDVFPFELISNPMLIKCDYVITSEDGQGETLEISGAKVAIPVQYLQWSGNCCYTYLFKITENTTGTTGLSGDKEGLFPITFDAVSVSTDVNDQSTLTTVDKYDITSYRTATDVYLVNTDKTTGNVIIPTAIGDESGNAQVYIVTSTGAEIDEVNINTYLTGTNNGLSLEPLKIKTGDHAGQFAAELVSKVPAADGTYYTIGDATHPGAVHFPSEMGYAYAYVYCKTKHVNPTYTKVAAGAVWSSTTTYYTLSSSGVYSAASGVTEAYFNANKSSLYTQTTAGTPGEYAVMLLDTRGY